MKKLLAVASALSGFLALSGGAIAADAVVDAGYDWSGVYLGIQGGYGFGNTDWRYDDLGGGQSDDGNFDGILGGLTAGANLQMDSIVFGIEGDLSLSDIDGSSKTSSDFNCQTPCTTDLEWLGTLRARLGYAMGNTLPYVTGGLAVGDARASAPSFGTFGEDTLYGWTAGGGIEHAFSDSLSAKIEYLYVDLGDLDVGAPCTPDCFSPVKFSIVRAGLNFNF